MRHWILLRGLMREARHWGDFPEMLATGLPDAQVVALDLPGNGIYHQERSPGTISAMTEHCRQQCHALGILPPYHLLALSLGGMVASDWASRYPEEVSGAVLINTSLHPYSPFYHRLRPRQYATLIGLLCNPSNAPKRERTILRLTSNRAAPDELLQSWIRFAIQHPVRPINAMRQLLAAVRYRAQQPPPSVALLILSGGGDRLVNPRCSRALHQRWQAPLKVQPDAGHDLTLDAPGWVVAQVRLWITSED